MPRLVRLWNSLEYDSMTRIARKTTTYQISKISFFQGISESDQMQLLHLFPERLEAKNLWLTYNEGNGWIVTVLLIAS